MDVLRRLRARSFDAIVVDPPYGIGWQSNSRRADARFPKLLNDERPYIWFLHDAFRVCREPGALVCFSIARTQETFRRAIETAGLKVRSQLVWDRIVHGMGNTFNMFAPQHDIAWFATKGRFRFPGGRPKSVLRHMKVIGNKLVHPTEKPVALMMDLVRAVTPAGGRVLDPCMGSGTTGVACVRLGRRFVGIEQDVGYFNTARRRIGDAAKM